MGTADAPMEISEGGKTSRAWLATLPEDGPTGGFFHMKDAVLVAGARALSDF